MKFSASAASRLRTLREEGKLIYVTLNIPMPYPPRGTVPVNQGRGWDLFAQHVRLAFATLQPGNISGAVTAMPNFR